MLINNVRHQRAVVAEHKHGTQHNLGVKHNLGAEHFAAEHKSSHLVYWNSLGWMELPS